MKKEAAEQPVLFCVALFVICSAARCVEYFAVRTDQTAFAENFIHKLFGIGLVFLVLKALGRTWSGIGFQRENCVRQLGLGLLLGTACFFVSYGAELLVLSAWRQGPRLRFFADAFSISGRSAAQGVSVFIFLCLLFNALNVWMEEGLFRGLYLSILQEKYAFWIANLIAALLFGVWHWVMPMRDYFDGRSSVANLLVMGTGYIVLAGLMSLKWGMLYRLSGSLWIGLGDHFFNNTVTNLLHIVSRGGTDELQIVRIVLAQLLSFAIVGASYKKQMRG